MKKIILASASPRRSELLSQVGIGFTVQAAKGKEITSRTKPEEVVKELSYQKAREIYDKGNRDAIVIGADTIVYLEGNILGKPADKNDWRGMLQDLQGKGHHVFTGVSIIWCGDDNNTHVLSFEEDTKVYIHSMDDREIDEYISIGEAIDKAGGYGIQGYFAKYVERIEGDYNNVVGLPVAKLYQELKKLELV
ncbi:MAG: septum formation protein Maf [Lachnospiraceae bacterium]|nr:septum formation protein Maf [Candidatus Colinaster scatohippi]